MPGNTRLLVAVALAMVLLMVAIPGGAGECCHPYDVSHDGIVQTVCGDCSVPTPYCGFGPCNIFGCNCDGGCRRGGCDMRGGRQRDVFALMDTDRNRKVSFAEALAYFQDNDLPASRVKVKGFRGMDLDGDGFLTRREMDNGSDLVAEDIGDKYA